MTDAGWLEGRRPPPPTDLGDVLRARAGHVPSGENADSELLGLATVALSRALETPGRVRAAAFELLAADALVTYACEAALDREDVDGALAELVSIGGAP